MPALIYTVEYLLKIREEGEQKGEGEQKDGCYVIV